MKNLAIFLKLMYFYTSHAHRFIKGTVFYQDHKVLGSLYEDYDATYDAIIERMIGLGEDVDEFDVINSAVAEFNKYRSQDFTKNVEYFAQILAFEKQLCAILEEVNKNATLGTANLISTMADESEQRQYKIGQRVK